MCNLSLIKQTKCQTCDQETVQSEFVSRLLFFPKPCSASCMKINEVHSTAQIIALVLFFISSWLTAHQINIRQRFVDWINHWNAFSLFILKCAVFGLFVSIRFGPARAQTNYVFLLKCKLMFAIEMSNNLKNSLLNDYVWEYHSAALWSVNCID